MEDQFEMLSLAFPVIAGVVIVPIVAWLKRVIPTDWPIRAPLFALGLCALSIWGLSAWLAPDLSRSEIIKYVLAAQVFTQLIDSGFGTIKKIKKKG